MKLETGRARIPDALAPPLFPMDEMVKVFRDQMGCPLAGGADGVVDAGGG